MVSTRRGHQNPTVYSVGGVVNSKGSYNVQWEDNAAGGSNAQWQYLVRMGQPATTGFSGQKFEVARHKFNSRLVITQGAGLPNLVKTRTGYPSPATLPTRLSPTISVAENAALTKLYQRLREVDSAAQGMTILAELRETIHMLRRPGLALRKATEAYFGRVKRHAQRTRRRDLHKAIAGTYLEYAFGIVPFVHDTISVLEAIDKAYTEKRQRVRATGESSLGSVNTVLESKDESWYRVSTSNKTKLSVRYIVGLKQAAGGPSTSSLRETLGFSFTEFVPTLWEIVPWSFLVDYFTNIGDIISAVTYCRSKLAWSNRTERSVTEFNRSLIFDAARTRLALGQLYVSGSGSGSTISRRTDVRRTSALPGWPSLEISIPGSSSKWINIAALANQNASVLKLLHKR